MSEQGLSRSIGISLAAHALVLLSIFLRAVLVPDESIQIRNAIRVDVVDLPAKMTEPPKLEAAPPAPTSPPPKAEPPKEVAKPAPKPEPEAPTVSLNNKKQENLGAKQKLALNKLKTMDALNKIEHELNKEKAAKTAGLQIKGNQVSEGNALTGLDKIKYDRYHDELKKKVLSQFNLPQWLAEGQFKASVQVLINEQGYVIKKVVRRSSGNDIFDSKVIEAIDASSPLPAPPESLRARLATSGVTFNFPEQ